VIAKCLESKIRGYMNCDYNSITVISIFLLLLVTINFDASQRMIMVFLSYGTLPERPTRCCRRGCLFIFFLLLPLFAPPFRMSSQQQSDASSSRGEPTSGELRVLRWLGTQHETVFPFWEPGKQVALGAFVVFWVKQMPNLIIFVIFRR
jgi:hypothetical protein